MLPFTALCLALVVVSATAAKFFSDSEGFNRYQFDQFVNRFSRKYATKDEAEFRFSVFLSNLKLIDERNEVHVKNGGRSAVHGINQFADMSQEEFKQKYLTLDASKMMSSKAKPALIEGSPKSTGLVGKVFQIQIF